jgi:GT2 family glycosyltransferase
MKTVSIHIVTYNSEAHIAACLDSVFRQTYPISKVIVVDNGSSDGTLAILEQYGERIEIITNSRNAGFAPAHNQAIRASACDFFLVLNPDIRMDPDYVAHLVEAFESRPGLGSATGKLLRLSDPDVMDSAGLVMNRARRAFDRGAGEPECRWNEPGEVFGVSGAAALYAATMVRDISVDGQFFDEDFFAYKEDVDVAWRARLLGWSAYYEPKAIAYHERGWKSGERSKKPLFIRRRSYINRYKMMVKNDRFLYVLRHFVLIGLYELLNLGYAIVREPKLLGAWLDFWGKLPALLRMRRRIASRQRVTDKDIFRWFR